MKPLTPARSLYDRVTEALHARVTHESLAGLWTGESDASLELALHAGGTLSLGEARVASGLSTHFRLFVDWVKRAKTHRDRVLVAQTLALATLHPSIAELDENSATALDMIIHRFAQHPDPAVRLPALRARGGLLRVKPITEALQTRLARELQGGRAGAHASVRRRALTSVACAPRALEGWAVELLRKTLDAMMNDSYAPASFFAALPAIEPGGAVAAFADELLDAGLRNLEASWGAAEGLRFRRGFERETEDSAHNRRMRELFASVERLLSESQDVFVSRKAWDLRWASGRGYLGESLDAHDFMGQCEALLFEALHGSMALGPRVESCARHISRTILGIPRTSEVHDVPRGAGAKRERAAVSHAQAVLDGAGRAASLRLWEPILESLGWKTDEIDELSSSVQGALEQSTRALLERPGTHKVWRQLGFQLLGNWVDAARPGRAQGEDPTPEGPAESPHIRPHLGPTPGEALSVLQLALQQGSDRADEWIRPFSDVVVRLLPPGSEAGEHRPARRFVAWNLLHTADTARSVALLPRIDDIDPRVRTRIHEAEKRIIALLEDLRCSKPSPAWTGELVSAWEVLSGSADPLFSLLAAGLYDCSLRLGSIESISNQEVDRWLQAIVGIVRLIQNVGEGVLPDGRGGRIAPAPLARSDERQAPAPTLVVSPQKTLPGGRNAPLPSDAPAASPPPIAGPPAIARSNPSNAERALISLTTASFDGQREDNDALNHWKMHAGPLFAPLVAQFVTQVGERVRVQHEGGPTMGHYQLTTRIASGGMGEVWLARRKPDPDDTQGASGLFAIKLPLITEPDPEKAKRLDQAIKHEARMMLHMQHPNVVRFVDHGSERAQSYLVMEFLRGVSLDEYLRIRPLRPWEMAPIVSEICKGLSALHAQAIVHCDLKPSNVYLCLEGAVSAQVVEARRRDPIASPILRTVLIDLGVARKDQTSLGNFFTQGYCAPEQIERKPERASDVYALAATVFHAMTGTVFFDQAMPEVRPSIHLTRAPLDEASAEGSRDLAVQRNVQSARRWLTAPVIRLLRDATQLDPSKRPSIEEFNLRFARATC